VIYLIKIFAYDLLYLIYKSGGLVMRWLKKQNIFMCLLSLLISPLVFAKPVNLYDQPKTDSKVVGTVDSSASLVPIFNNKEGDWMKVGDPKNGNTGWVKVSDFSENKPGMHASGFSMTEQTVNTKDGPKTYRTIQFNNPTTMSPTEAQATMKKIQEQQAAIQKRSQEIMQNIYKDMNSLYMTNPAAFSNQAYPVFMPVIIVPAQPAPPANPKPAPKS
jgi:SH3-like domain-containing protein